MVALATVAAAGLPIMLAPLIAAAATATGVVEPPVRRRVHRALRRATPSCSARNALRSGIGQAAIVVGPALGAMVLLASHARGTRSC